MSRTLSTNSGSLDNLNVWLRCGCKPNAAHIRRIVVNGCSAMARPLTHLTHGISSDPSDPWVVRTGINGCSAMASGGRPAALHVTDNTGRHLRYTSRAKREADVSLSHRCTMEHPLHHGAPRCDVRLQSRARLMASSTTRWVRWRIKVKA